jgi:osmotically-inducible protein OsmY
MQIKLLTLAIVTAASLAACTTRPVTVNTPGPGQTTIQVPVPANQNMMLTDQVNANLKSGMGSDAAGIQVRADGTTVYLTGHVATSALREQAHSIAHGTAGVSSVVYEGLTVQ